MNAIIETNGSLTLNNLFYQMGDYLYKNGLTLNIKGKIYPNRTGFRQLAMYLGISIEIKKEQRLHTQNYFIYEYSVKATSKDGRYTECSASCSSNEREFNNLENDVRTIAQTRATNRAIADLLGITDITNYIKSGCTHNSSFTSQPSQRASIKHNSSEDTSEGNEDSENSNTITPKQKELLIKLIQEIFDDKEEQKAYIESLEELNKQEANFHIKQLLEEKATRG